MKDEILNEVRGKLNWREKIIVYINKKTFVKVCHKVRIETVNKLLK
mgnify:CR=1 FL=1